MSSASHTYPPTATAVAFPPPPPTSNNLSSQERNALIRSSKKLGRILGDVPRFIDEDHDAVSPSASRPSTSSGLPQLTRTTTGSTTASFASTQSTSRKPEKESSWGKRKPTHLPPLLKLSGGVAVDSSSPTLSSPYQRPPTRRASVLSTAPSIVSNAPSTNSSSSAEGPSESTQRRTKLERLRRKLGDEVPSDAVFPSSPHTPRTAVPQTPRTRSHSHARSRSTHIHADDARSITFSISSDESFNTVTLSASTHVHSPHPHHSQHRTKHPYHAGALPPVPPIPAHLTSSSRHGQGDEDDAGLIRPRQKVAAGSKIGGADFKAARRAKREGRHQTGQADVGELVEMVGFMGGF
ncbi:hypothetical protein HYDPIDRAFT_30604 [Hydnomerulius pinastri MD-312]|uniref:Uncharacterized protein n=1 Tax=Hydnomerulius pinastri MD-312 TaxID=994086 RepID=A0A0C9WCQ4_9AGAM|nr:hypothetical protein HYDPIDRAFT_30604 [Hydnomerulius pinastri MD-312]